MEINGGSGQGLSSGDGVSAARVGRAPTAREWIPRTAREYLRVSRDRSGRERSPDEQHDDNERACHTAGLRLLEPYREAGAVSASRYGHKVRDDFARLLADLEAGRFGADVLVLWESSRGSRKVAEWVALIELCEQQHVNIFVTTHGREYDPANSRDRRSLLEDAVDAEYESSKTAARVRRATAANAAQGRPHGPCPYGYRRLYDERSGRLVGQEPHPEEAPVVRELFARLQAGEALNAIAVVFAEKGIRTRSGRVFTGPHLRSLAIKATYAGVRVHVPNTERGAGARPVGFAGVSHHKATWPPLVEMEQFLAVQEILTDPKRRKGRPGRARHLLSRIARCGACGTPLAANIGRGRAGYQCPNGHVRILTASLDEVAETAMLAYLARPEVHQRLSAPDEQTVAELARVREALAHARSELRLLHAAVGAGTASVASLTTAEPGMLATIARLEQQEGRLMTPGPLRGLIETGADVEVRWEAAIVSTRREIARILLSPQFLGYLLVDPAGHRSVPAVERVRWHREPLPDPEPQPLVAARRRQARDRQAATAADAAHPGPDAPGAQE